MPYGLCNPYSSRDVAVTSFVGGKILQDTSQRNTCAASQSESYLHVISVIRVSFEHWLQMKKCCTISVASNWIIHMN